MAPSGESFRNTFFFLRMVQSFYRRYLQNTTNNVTGAQEDHDMPGLDIGYVPAGPHAFLRLSGHHNLFSTGPRGQCFFFLVLRMPPLFLLEIGKTRKATLIRTYFSLYIGLMYKSLQLHA